MEKLFKFKDLSHNEVLNFKELATVFGGGGGEADGCKSYICIDNRSVGEGMCTDAVCTSGIGPCQNQTECSTRAGGGGSGGGGGAG